MEPARQSLGGVLRQTLVSFFTENQGLITLKFTNPPEVADFSNSIDQYQEKIVDVLLLLTLTKVFDIQIAAAFLNEDSDSSPRFLEMPFGDSHTFDMVVDWIRWDREPKDFVALQGCVEFARFYGIAVPRNEDVDIIHKKLSSDRGVCCEGWVCEEEERDEGISLPTTSHDSDTEPETVSGEFLNSGKLLVVNGVVYKRRWANRRRDGWYYYCAAKGCSGAIFVPNTGGIRKVKEHSREHCIEENRISASSATDVKEWKIIAAEMKRLVDENQTMQSFEILSMFMDEHENLRDAILTAPIPAILQFISSLRRKNSLCLNERLTQSSRIEQGCIIYQQVVPSKLLVYSCKESQKLASHVEWLLIDGTFRRCPKQFYQCVTLLSRDETNGVFFPICHCLLPNKEADTYAQMFSILESSFSFPKLAFVTVDFEKALISSVRTWMSRKQRAARLLGCKFHFSKCLNKHFRKSKTRRLEPSEKYFIQQFVRFPFLPKKDILAILEALQTVEHPYQDFIRYFTQTWMKDDTMFELWNFSSMDDEGLITLYTNNAIEAFHKRMSLELSPHPQIQRFLRWVESYGKEKHRSREVITPRNSTKDSQQWRDSVDIRACWTQILQNFVTKPEFCALHFEFTCPECQSVNVLAGRRQSHLRCENQNCVHSKIELPCECVFTQAKESLIHSYLNQTGARYTFLAKLEFWLHSLIPSFSTEGEKKYLFDMRKLAQSLWRCASSERQQEQGKPVVQAKQNHRTFRVQQILEEHRTRQGSAAGKESEKKSNE